MVGLFPAAIDCRENKAGFGAAPSTVFEGTSPGVIAERPFLKIPADERCDFIRWKLTLLHDAQTNSPTTFSLEREYGFYVDNRTDKSMGKTVITGHWEMTTGTKSNAAAIVYRLHAGQHTISFWQVDKNLLHLLHDDKSLMTGNGGQSFTLSRTSSIIPPMSIYQSLQASASATSGIQDTVLTYVGRTPCTAIAKEMHLPADQSCFKLKWKLRLFQDPKTFQPTRYQLARTFHRQSIIEGSWTIVKGSKTDSSVTVYRMDAPAQEPGPSLFLMKGDDNVLFFLDKAGHLLVGNDLFSYTLNRDKQ